MFGIEWAEKHLIDITDAGFPNDFPFVSGSVFIHSFKVADVWQVRMSMLTSVPPTLRNGWLMPLTTTADRASAYSQRSRIVASDASYEISGTHMPAWHRDAVMRMASLTTGIDCIHYAVGLDAELRAMFYQGAKSFIEAIVNPTDISHMVEDQDGIKLLTERMLELKDCGMLPDS